MQPLTSFRAVALACWLGATSTNAAFCGTSSATFSPKGLQPCPRPVNDNINTFCENQKVNPLVYTREHTSLALASPKSSDDETPNLLNEEAYDYEIPEDEDDDDDDDDDEDYMLNDDDIDYDAINREWEAQQEAIHCDDSVEFYSGVQLDEDGVEIGYDPIFGPSNPIDERAMITEVESYVVSPKTRSDEEVEEEDQGALAPPPKDATEEAYQEEIRSIRRAMKRLETYEDPWLKVQVPRHVRTYRGQKAESDYKFEPKDFSNNRFTLPEDKTDFSKFTPYRARKKAVEMARAHNNEWLPEGFAAQRHAEKTEPFRKHNTLVGTTQKGPQPSPALVEKIQPALRILGSSVDLLSYENGVFRFHYHGLMKNKRGMSTWARLMIREDCGVEECTGVVFETGRRQLDDRDNLFKDWC